MSCSVRRAFTIIELLIVVTVIGILGAASYPRLAHSISGNTVQAAATVAAADVEAAFSLAARTRRPLVYTCSAVLRRCRATDQATGAVLSERLFDRTSGFEVTSLAWSPSIEGQAVIIGSAGIATQGFAITMSHGKSAKRVVVLRSGLIWSN